MTDNDVRKWKGNFAESREPADTEVCDARGFFFYFLKEMKVQRYQSDSRCLVSQNPSDSSLRQTRGKWQEIPELLECVTKLKKKF